MSNLVPAGSASVSRRSDRLSGRVLAQIEAETDIGLARIESAAELQVARVMAVGCVGKQAMHEVALISQLEQQLATLVPMATGRLQAIGDMMALDAAEIVSDTVRQVRR